MSRSLMIDELFGALVAADRRRVEAITNGALARGLGPLEVYEDVYAPALHAIGEGWADNRLSVTTEHIATALMEAEMTRLVPQFLAGVRAGRVALVAAVEGEDHRVGVRMVADCFETFGWDAQFVGAGVPLEALLAHVAELEPDVVALSVTMPMNLSGLVHTVRALVARWPRLPVLVGGQAIAHLAADQLPKGEAVRVVGSLARLKGLIRSMTHAPDGPLPMEVDFAPPPLRPAALSRLVAEVERLPSVPSATVDAFEATADRLVADVDAYLLAQPGLAGLVGAAGQRSVRENHRHHALFVASWLRHGNPESLVRTLAWVIKTYRRRGFSVGYLDRELEAWQVALSANLTPGQAAALRPHYQWMRFAIGRIEEAIDGD